MSDFFADIPKITYQGPDAESRMAYRYYDKNKKVLGKTMEEHLRMAICYWHTFCWDGFDIFGGGTFNRPWHKVTDAKEAADAKLDDAFTFFTKMDLPYFCFHDVDVMAPVETPQEHIAELGRMVDQIGDRIEKTGVQLLWGTANLFSHPRYMAGGATNPDADVVAFAGLQVRECLNATHKLGGSNYVLWGGREGYDTLLNTDLRQERDQFGRFLSMVVEHKHKIGFKGDILIEPKPHEPTKNQYDRDVATVHGMLTEFGLQNEVKVNIEPNHATLAGHSFEHEIEMANALGVFGSIDINRGDPQNGWDTDQFAYDLREVTLVMYYILKAGGFGNGGFNFDAKVRRQSNDAADLFHGHVGGADLLARALLGAADMIEKDELQAFKDARYTGWDKGHGKSLLDGSLSLDQLADVAKNENLTPAPKSGRQEMLENIVNDAVK